MVIPPSAPGAVDARVRIARLAMDFFDPEKPNPFADALGKPDYDRDTLTGEDFRQYLLENADFFTVPPVVVKEVTVVVKRPKIRALKPYFYWWS
jgi:hypothetical protein